MAMPPIQVNKNFVYWRAVYDWSVARYRVGRMRQLKYIYICDYYELKDFQRLNFSTSVVGTFFSSKVLWYFETSLGKVTCGELTFLMFKFALESATGQAMPS